MSLRFVRAACESFALEIRYFYEKFSLTWCVARRLIIRIAVCEKVLYVAGVIYEIFTAFHDACNKL